MGTPLWETAVLTEILCRTLKVHVSAMSQPVVVTPLWETAVLTEILCRSLEVQVSASEPASDGYTTMGDGRIN